MCALTRDLVNKWRRTHRTEVKIDRPCRAERTISRCKRMPPTPSLWCYLCCNEKERERVSVLICFHLRLSCFAPLASFRQDQRVRLVVAKLKLFNGSVYRRAGASFSMKLLLLMKIDTMTANLDILKEVFNVFIRGF